MKTTIKTISIILMVSILIVILSAGSKNQYRVSQLRGKWQLETGTTGPYRSIDEYSSETYTSTCIMNGDTVIRARYWFYLSDSIVTTFDWHKVGDRTRGVYIVAQSGEDFFPPYEFPCKIFRIISLNRDSLVMIRVPSRGEYRIGLEPISFKRIK